jgi:CheY-like chemotaxis protein
VDNLQQQEDEDRTGAMQERIFVKVVGFSNVERHALNTVFRLSAQRAVGYALWTPGSGRVPELALVDASHQGVRRVPLAPAKLIWVGDDAPLHAQRVMQRPLQWPALLLAMDELIGADADIVEVLGVGQAAHRVLVAEALFEDRLYLLSKLASLDLTRVDEAASGAQALDWLRRQKYAAALVSLDLSDINAWDLIAQLKAQLLPTPLVIATTAKPSMLKSLKARRAGCLACLAKPLEPPELTDLLQGIHAAAAPAVA